VQSRFPFHTHTRRKERKTAAAAEAAAQREKQARLRSFVINSTMKYVWGVKNEFDNFQSNQAWSVSWKGLENALGSVSLSEFQRQIAHWFACGFGSECAAFGKKSRSGGKGKKGDSRKPWDEILSSREWDSLDRKWLIVIGAGVQSPSWHFTIRLAVLALIKKQLMFIKKIVKMRWQSRLMARREWKNVIWWWKLVLRGIIMEFRPHSGWETQWKIASESFASKTALCIFERVMNWTRHNENFIATGNRTIFRKL